MKNHQKTIKIQKMLKNGLFLAFIGLSFILVSSLVSAQFNFDNVKQVTSENTITIKNSILGIPTTDAAKLTRNTPSHVLVIPGKNRLVAEITFETYEDYKDALNNMQLINLRTGREFENKVYTYKLKVQLPDMQEPIYDLVCNEKPTELENKTQSLNCREQITGYNNIPQYTWEKLGTELKSGINTVGIFTDVEHDEIGEWIPTDWFGVDIPEWSVWSDSLNVGLLTYLKLNETGGTIGNDSMGRFNITVTAAQLNAQGIIGTGYTTNANSGQLTPYNDTGDFTFNFWINRTGGITDFFFGTRGDAGTNDWYLQADAGSNLDLWGTGGNILDFPFVTGRYTMLTITINSTSMTLYRNGTRFGNTGPSRNIVYKFSLFAKRELNYDITGINVDEISFYNRTLAPSEVSDLWNGGAGLTYYSSTPYPVVTLTGPADNSIYSLTSVDLTFECNGSDDTNLTELKLIGGNNSNVFILTGNGTTKVLNLTRTYTFYDGGYTWNCSGTDNLGQVTTTSRSFIVHGIAPIINTTYPIGQYDFWIWGKNLTYNFTVAESRPSACWYKLSTSDRVIFRNTTRYSGSYQFGNCGSGGFTNQGNAYDNDWTTFASGYDACLEEYAIIPSTAQLTTVGWTEKIAQPWSVVTYNMYCRNWSTVGPSYLLLNSVGLLNGNITGTLLPECINSTYGLQIRHKIIAGDASHTVSLYEGEYSWYDYNYTSLVNVGCSANTTSYNGTNYGKFWFYANDTAANLNYTSIPINATIVQHAFVYNKTVYQTSSENYIITLDVNTTYWSSLLSTFIYNGTRYSTTSDRTGTQFRFMRTLEIPLIVNSSTKNIYFEIQATNSSGTYFFNSSIEQQIILNHIFQRCNGTLSPVYLNISFRNETDKNNITATLNINVLYSISGTKYNNYSFNSSIKEMNYTFCAQPNSTSIKSNWVAEVTSGGFYDRSFYIFGDTYTTTATERILYIAEEGTPVIVSVRRNDMIPLVGWYAEIYRYYPGDNTFAQIEYKKTDMYGQFVARLNENSIRYKFVFKNESGAIKQINNDVTVACKSNVCVLPFIIESTDDYFNAFTNTTSYDYSLSFNENTNTFIFAWNDVTGESITNELKVERVLGNGSTIICDTSNTATSGSMNCLVGDMTASYFANAYRNTVEENRRVALLAKKVNNDVKMGVEGYLISAIFLLMCLTFGYWKPTVGVVMFGAAFILFGIMGFVYINPGILVAMGVVLVVFLWAFKG